MKEAVKDLAIKRGSTAFLRAAVITLGLVVLALCVFALPAAWRDVTTEYPSHTYVFYTIILGMYVSAVPFFVALYQTLQMLKHVDDNNAFSELTVKNLKVIKYCAVAISAVYVACEPFFYIWAENDDAPGLVIVGMAFVLAPLAIAVFAAVLQRLLREAIDMKAENDLTV